MLCAGRRSLLFGSALRRFPRNYASKRSDLTDLGRTLATAPQKASTISEILSNVAKTHPLKDAAKFFETTNDQVMIWTYSDLKAHVDALANGLKELDYKDGDHILLWAPAGSAEYMTTVMAGSKIGVNVVIVDVDTTVDEVKELIKKYKAKMLIVWHEFGEDVQELIERIAPGVGEKDAQGLSGFTRLTGKQPEFADMPSLEHLVHTGSDIVRGATCFKNLMVYNSIHGAKEVSSKGSEIIEGKSGKSVTEKQLVDEASKIGESLQLTSEHESKKGRVVVPGQADSRSIAACVSALMNEALLVSPSLSTDEKKTKTVADHENAVVFT